MRGRLGNCFAAGLAALLMALPAPARANGAIPAGTYQGTYTGRFTGPQSAEIHLAATAQPLTGREDLIVESSQLQPDGSISGHVEGTLHLTWQPPGQAAQMQSFQEECNPTLRPTTTPGVFDEEAHCATPDGRVHLTRRGQANFVTGQLSGTFRLVLEK